MDLPILVLIGLGVFLAGTAFGYVFRRQVVRKRADTIEARIQERLEKVQDQAQEIILEAKKKGVEILEKANEELKQERLQIQKTQERLLKEGTGLEEKTAKVGEKEAQLNEQVEKVKTLKEELEGLRKSEIEKLEKVANLSKDEARGELFRRVEEEAKDGLAEALGKLEKERRDQVERKAQEIMTTVIQRYARSNVGEVTTSVVPLPNEDLKGRIIGREGRNIRHLERITGVEIIVDEMPEAITLSSFDPVRREIARIALEALIQDGRIQPARIEEKVEEARKEVNQKIREAGEQAVYEVGILDLPPEIIHLLGRLAFRTSFGQNVLMHSVEVAILAGMIAQELGLDAEIAKKGGILHDIGKAVDHEIEGTHLELGRRILEKYKVDERVVKAMQSHHEDYPIEIPEAYVVNAADAISGARPGARRETLEHYLKRLSDLERIANSFDGVEHSYAIQAGREIRVFVLPEKVDDYGAIKLAKDIANRIEEELKYPGEIKVNVIRETRAVEVAR